jgi:uncharacterized Zn finger protein
MPRKVIAQYTDDDEASARLEQELLAQPENRPRLEKWIGRWALVLLGPKT